MRKTVAAVAVVALFILALHCPIAKKYVLPQTSAHCMCCECENCDCDPCTCCKCETCQCPR